MNIIAQKQARILEIWSYICLLPAIYGLILVWPNFSGDLDFTRNIPFIIVTVLFVPGEMLLIGYIKLSRNKSVWCGESIFWVCSLLYNLILIGLYAPVGLLLVTPLPAVSLICSWSALCKTSDATKTQFDPTDAKKVQAAI